MLRFRQKKPLNLVDLNPVSPMEPARVFLSKGLPQLRYGRCFYAHLSSMGSPVGAVKAALETLAAHSLNPDDLIILERAREFNITFPKAYRTALWDLCAQNGVPLHRVVILSQAQKDGALNKWREALSWAPYHTYHDTLITAYEEVDLGSFAYEDLYTTSPKFISLNRKLRGHRWILLRHLENASYAQDVFRTELHLSDKEIRSGARQDEHHWSSALTIELKKYFPSYDRYLPENLDLHAVHPSGTFEELGEVSLNKNNLIYAMPVEATKASHLALVTETEFRDLGARITEKTLKVMVYHRPFVVFAYHGALALLRSYGFKTFHPFIDETYDTITDPDARMTALLAEVDRLHDVLSDPKTRAEFLDGVKEAVRFNQAYLKGQYRSDMEARTLDALKRQLTI